VSGTLNETRFVLRDYLDPVAILTAAGVVDERYGYEAFGPVRVMDANFATRSSSTCAWNWLYHGEFLDGESGMYDYGYRFYHPALGRWASRDPIGERGGLNLYGFVGNDGIRERDMIGLKRLTLKYSVGDPGPGEDKTSLQDVLDSVIKAVGIYREDGKDPCNCVDSLTIYTHGTVPQKWDTPFRTKQSAGKHDGGGIQGTPEELITPESLRDAAKNPNRTDPTNPLRDPGATIVKQLSELMCTDPDGKIHFRACRAGRGKRGGELLDELENYFGEGNVTLPQNDVHTFFGAETSDGDPIGGKCPEKPDATSN
jgi:RHS repeat-associated protein